MFTDDDLKRLKLLKHFNHGYGYYPKVASTKLMALVARLDSAELLLSLMIKNEQVSPQISDALKVWRKSMGKSGVL